MIRSVENYFSKVMKRDFLNVGHPTPDAQCPIAYTQLQGGVLPTADPIIRNSRIANQIISYLCSK